MRKSNDWILRKLHKSEILELLLIIRVAMEIDESANVIH